MAPQESCRLDYGLASSQFLAAAVARLGLVGNVVEASRHARGVGDRIDTQLRNGATAGSGGRTEGKGALAQVAGASWRCGRSRWGRGGSVAGSGGGGGRSRRGGIAANAKGVTDVAEDAALVYLSGSRESGGGEENHDSVVEPHFDFVVVERKAKRMWK